MLSLLFGMRRVPAARTKHFDPYSTKASAMPAGVSVAENDYPGTFLSLRRSKGFLPFRRQNKRKPPPVWEEARRQHIADGA